MKHSNSNRELSNHSAFICRPLDYLRETQESVKLGDMRKILSKNTLIGLLLFSNLAFAVALFGDLKEQPKAIQKPSVKPPGPSKGQIQGVDLRNDSQIQACYEAFLMRSPPITEGTVVMNWVLDETGQIDFLKLARTDLADEGFTSCLLDTIRATRFPASVERAGVMISHKFKFRRKTPDSIEFQ